MTDFNPTQFLGLIPETPRPSDYIAGVNSPLVGTILIPSGDWSPYVPLGERQSVPFETFNCTAFSLTNVIETLLKFFISQGKVPQSHIDFLNNEGYRDPVTGDINCSERALGSMAGTTSAGNRLTTVIDTARKFGIAADKTWPFGGSNLTEYYATPPANVATQALKFLDYFQINYEWFYNSPGTLTDAIKECPLWVALCTCGGWNTPPVAWCNAGDATNHAVELVKHDNINDPKIFDSYIPYLKDLALNYNIPYALKVFVTIKQPSPMIRRFIVNDHGTLGVMLDFGQGMVIFMADNPAHFTELKDANGMTGQEPTVNIP